MAVSIFSFSGWNTVRIHRRQVFISASDSFTVVSKKFSRLGCLPGLRKVYPSRVIRLYERVKWAVKLLDLLIDPPHLFLALLFGIVELIPSILLDRAHEIADYGRRYS
jgi:hypothetical protein